MRLITGIVNGRPENEAQFFENCKYFEGKKVDITIKKHQNLKTHKQLGYAFGVIFQTIVKYRESLGHNESVVDWYDYYKFKGYFGYQEFNGELVGKGLSKATTLEVNEAKERIQREWAEQGLIIPDPNQEEFL